MYMKICVSTPAVNMGKKEDQEAIKPIVSFSSGKMSLTQNLQAVLLQFLKVYCFHSSFSIKFPLHFSLAEHKNSLFSFRSVYNKVNFSPRSQMMVQG